MRQPGHLALRAIRFGKRRSGALELLKAAESKLSTTFNYNDFHWTNLAVSRGRVNSSRSRSLIFTLSE